MYCRIASLLLLTILASCDCRKGPTGPAAYFKNLVENPESKSSDLTSFKRFQSGLKHQSFWELGQSLEPLQNFHHEPVNIPAPVRNATDRVIKEVISRNPDWVDVHRFLGDDYFGGPRSWFLFPALAKEAPESGWQLLSSFYRETFRYYTETTIPHEHAKLFFSNLKKHHPTFARSCLKKLLNEFSYETASLRTGAVEAFLTSMTKPEEALSFIAWLRQENLENVPVGFFGLYRDFLRITPNKIERNHIITNALITLTELSPSEAETWIIHNRKANSLPSQWALAYVIGSYRHDRKSVESAYQFVARNSKPNDGALDSIFSFYYFYPDTKTLKNLHRIQGETDF